ncbi:MAG: TIM barrel protein [Planctomycetes bacterium]|nr:TIM barrel protein [Planctomycetota bacterium]
MDVAAVSRDVHGNISRAIWMLSQAEIHYVEATNWTNDVPICRISDDQLHELKRMLGDRDMRVSMIETTLDGPQGMERWERELDIAAALDTKHVRVAPFEKEACSYEEIVATLQQAAKKAKPRGLIVTIQNSSPDRYASSPEEIKALMRDVSADNFHLCWDPCAHARFHGRGWGEMEAARGAAMQFADYVHITDMAAEPDEKYVCIGDGVMDYRAIFQDMISSGYSGFYALRPRYGKGDIRMLKQNCAALREILREARRVAAATE